MRKCIIFINCFLLLFIFFSVSVYAEHYQYNVKIFKNGTYQVLSSNNPIIYDMGMLKYKGSLSFYREDGTHITDNSFVSVYTNATGFERIEESDHDIIRYDDGTIFFLGRVKSFMEMVQKMNLMNLLTHPILGIVSSLIGLWIIYLAFSKAWQFLLRTLRQV